MCSPSAFCDEDVITQKQEEHEQDSRHEMYSEQRKEMMSKQVTSLHQSKAEQVSSSTCLSSEAQSVSQRDTIDESKNKVLESLIFC